MSTNKETNNYSIDTIKKNASTGTLVGSGTADLKNYGIDYSPEQRDEIAGIFANQATQAYGTAQNNYSNQMAQQQASLQDTIRRSQAQAVATGASRGMQAANELSSMLGLQEQAAQGATTLQGDYATALANAQKDAMDVQTARAQAGAEVAAADIAGEAQKYSVNMDYQANDPFRAIAEVLNLRNSGNNAAADALLMNWAMASGLTESQAANIVSAANSQSSGKIDASSWASKASATNLRDSVEGDNFKLNVGGSNYKLELGTLESANSPVAAAAQNAGVPTGTAFAYTDAQGNSKLYIRTSDGVRQLGGRGITGVGKVNEVRGDYAAALNAIIGAGNVLKA